MAKGKLSSYIWLSSSSKNKTFLTRMSRINGIEFQNRWGNSKSQKFQVHRKTFGDSESLLIRKRNKEDARRWESKRYCHSFQEGERKISENNDTAWDIHHWANMQSDLETDDLWILDMKAMLTGMASQWALRAKRCSANFRTHGYLESAKQLMVLHDNVEK